MKYSTIQPPFSLDFWEMNRREARTYFSWFIEQIPIRITILEEAVRTSAQTKFLLWQADESVASLDLLGHWFANQVETKTLKENEREEFHYRSATWFKDLDAENWSLTNETISLAIDVGMYLSRVFLSNLPGLEWEMSTRKSDIDFQQPVIGGFGKLKFNPVQVAITLAYGYADNTYSSDRLRELYDIWAGYVAKK